MGWKPEGRRRVAAQPTNAKNLKWTATKLTLLALMAGRLAGCVTETVNPVDPVL